MGHRLWVVEVGCGWFMANWWFEEGDIGGLRKVSVGSLDVMVGL